jgi:hypothetical protein
MLECLKGGFQQFMNHYKEPYYNLFAGLMVYYEESVPHLGLEAKAEALKNNPTASYKNYEEINFDMIINKGLESIYLHWKDLTNSGSHIDKWNLFVEEQLA